MAVRKAGRVLISEDSGWVRKLAADAERAFAVENVDQTLAVMIVINPGACTDGSLAVGGICHRKTRGDVVFRLGPEAGPVVKRARRSKVQVRLIDLALQRCCLALLIPGMSIDGWRYLLPVGLPWCLQDGMAYTEGQRQIRLHAPGVLKIVFVLICLELASKRGAIG